MTFLDVGQGDATLLQAPDVAVLIDAGRHDRSDVTGHLADLGVDALDLVVITHPHADHLGQFDTVVDAVDVAEVWWSGAEHTTQTFDRALDALEASDAAYEEPRAGDTTSVGPLDIHIVNPPHDANFNDLHDSGLGLRVSFGDVGVLFTGDIEASTEQRMLASDADWLVADIYQVGHHGSSTSTTQGFLEAVDPAVAVYSAGADNQYGHPHGEVVDRLEGYGVEVYGTDAHGTVTVTSDGQDWHVATERDGDIQPGQPDAEPEPEEEETEAAPAPGNGDSCEQGGVDIDSAGVEDSGWQTSEMRLPPHTRHQSHFLKA